MEDQYTGLYLLVSLYDKGVPLTELRKMLDHCDIKQIQRVLRANTVYESVIDQMASDLPCDIEEVYPELKET